MTARPTDPQPLIVGSLCMMESVWIRERSNHEFIWPKENYERFLKRQKQAAAPEVAFQMKRGKVVFLPSRLAPDVLSAAPARATPEAQL